MIVGYYYLHTNGDLIYQSGSGSVADIRDSSFAVGLWPIDVEDREGAWNLLVEALASGVSLERIKELAAKWGCGDLDAQIYADRVGCVLGDDGIQKTAIRHDFSDMQESPCGLGDTYLEAMADLARQIGFKPSKMWGLKFKDLVS